MGGLLGGGAKGLLAPPLKLLGGGGACPPLDPLFLRLCNNIFSDNHIMFPRLPAIK